MSVSPTSFEQIDATIDVMNKTLEEVVSMLQIEGKLIISTRCAIPFDVCPGILPSPAHDKSPKASPLLSKNRQQTKKESNNHITPVFSPVIHPHLLFGDYRLDENTGLVHKHGDDETALPRLTSKIDNGSENNMFYIPKSEMKVEKSEREGDIRMREILDECVEIQITSSKSSPEKAAENHTKNWREDELADTPDGDNSNSNKNNKNKNNKNNNNKNDDGDASSDSDSDMRDLPKMYDKPMKYPSDKPTANYSLEKSYTGKVAVSIFTVEGASSSGSRGTYYCTLETNNEFKAKTKAKPNDMMIIFDDAFDIEVQKAKALIITLYKQRSVFADKNIATSCIVFEKVFAENNNYKKLLLSATKGNVQILLSIKFTDARKHLQRKVSTRKSGVFGFNLSKTLANERNTIPTLVRKCVAEIERRGLNVEGIYRISGDARVKKELREKFEEDSHNVDISDEDIDCHVITGILKDYLRRLPNPLISEDMYKIMRDEREQVRNDLVLQKKMLSKMLKIAPYVNRATLIFIMDHLVVVVKHIDSNRMSGKNVAVCFGPVLMCPPIEEMIDFQKYIDALEFLISIWPTKTKQNMI